MLVKEGLQKSWHCVAAELSWKQSELGEEQRDDAAWSWSGSFTKRTRKREFLDEMQSVVLWFKLIALIEPHYPTGKTGRPPFPIATMLQIHFMQQWFGLSDPAMEEALYDVPLYREFAGLRRRDGSLAG
jgi:hypothetical protein